MTSARDQRRRMIGVSLGAKTMDEALAALPRIAAEADIAEIRLDYFEETYDLPRLLRDRPLPVIVTNRPSREGGRCMLPEDERLAVLRQAAALGAEYVDVEWDAAAPAILEPMKAAGTQILVSRHSFAEMPADFVDWADQMVERGADVVKIVGMARDARDCVPVFQTFQRADHPTVAIAMGEAGLPSRVLALRYDTCFLTYATLGRGERVAPGQLPIADMHRIYRAGYLLPTTAIYGVLGDTDAADDVAAYNEAFAEAEIDAVAVPVLSGRDIGEIIRAYRELPVAGWQIHGDAAQRAGRAVADEISPRARRQGKVNCLTVRADHTLGDWAETLDETLAVWLGR